MPIYEYACESCGHVFDVLQKMDAAPLLECPECSKPTAPLLECPECGKPTLKKLLSAPNFRLKGGGWYETDFKKDNQRNLAGDASDSSKNGKSDKKPTGTSQSPNKKSGDGAAPKTGSSGSKAD